jgi:dUTP pyrophosphatase
MTIKTQPIETTTEDLLESLKKTAKKAKATSKIKVSVLKQPQAKLPQYKTKKAAGADVYAHTNLPIWIKPGETKLVSTGLRVAIPEGYEIQVRPRSGLALSKSITVLNSPGTVDCDYSDEIGIIIINHGKENFEIKRGDRIAQLVLNKVEQIEWDETTEEKFLNLFEDADRSGGFGSTGVR